MFLTVILLYSSCVTATELRVVSASCISITYFFPQALQPKAYFSMSGKWLRRWALRLSLYTNPLRQCSHLNGRLSSGKWCIICFSYVSSLASSFPHSWHLKVQNMFERNDIIRIEQSLIDKLVWCLTLLITALVFSGILFCYLRTIKHEIVKHLHLLLPIIPCRFWL